jgi:hypothetical protein
MLYVQLYADLVYCRRRKIRCLPPVGEGDRCQNCARQQRECVVQPIAGSTRKGGRNQGNAVSTDPMPYAEALSLSRNQQNHTIAHRRASAKSPAERYHDHGYFPSNISISSYPYAGAITAGVPFSAPPHFTSPGLFPHYSEQAGAENARRPPFKHVQTAPGGMYTVHHAAVERSPGPQFRTSTEGYPGQWTNPGPTHYANTSAETYHPPNSEFSDPSNQFWRLGGGNITSPTPTEISLPPPRPTQGWAPQLSNYTHERPASSTVTLPTPNNSQLETPPFAAATPFYPPTINTAVGHPIAFASSTTQTSVSSHDEHCEPNHWSRPNSGYRSNGSI